MQLDAENVQKAALICFSDLEACVSNTNQVLANIVAYDRKIVEINPFSDGLVAYYITKLANCNNYGWVFKWRINIV